MKPAVAHPVPGPYLHTGIDTPRIMWEVSAALAPAAFAGWFVFGLPALLTIAWCVLFSVVFESLFDALLRRKPRIADGSAFLAGLLLALNLPPQTPWNVCAAGSFVAIVIVKGAFGGLGRNIFNPALAGRAFCMAVFPAALASYSVPVRSFLSTDAVTSATPLAILKTGGLDTLISAFGDKSHLFLHLLAGDRGGCIGETSIAALLIGGVYLIGRNIISWHIPVSMVAAAGIFAWITGGSASMAVVHILTGGLVLGAFFMATDYVTSPTYPLGKIVFGAGCGLILMSIRTWGGFPEGCMFSILIMNLFTPLIDRLTLPRRYGATVKR